MPLVACPFCHDLFPQGEALVCPVCGMKLTDLKNVPLSEDARAEEPFAREPLFEPLPFAFTGRLRGPLVVLGLVGVVLFFLPWIDMTMPDIKTLSGFDVSRRLGWSWASGVAWGVLIPTVLSRRSIMQMRGARVAVFFLSAIPGVTAAMLLLRPVRGGHGIPIHYSYEWPIYATLVTSLLAALISWKFGGRADDIRVAEGSGRGQTLH